MTAAWDLKLDPAAKLVLLSLADQSNDDGACWPSMATLTRRTGLSERTVQRHLLDLASDGHLTRHSRPGRSNWYTVHPRHDDTPVTVSPPSQRRDTPVTMTGHPRHSDTHNRNRTVKEPSDLLSGKPDEGGGEVEKPKPKRTQQAEEVLRFLNERAHRAYQPTEVNLGLIVARLKEGYTVEQCRMVIARKVRDWALDERMAQYLRPATLFNREKFNQYVGECVVTPGNQTEEAEYEQQALS